MTESASGATHRLPCELVGGPRDGLVYEVPEGPDGLPVDRVELPAESDLSSLLWRLSMQLPAPGVLVYRRDRISDRTHRWVYRLATPPP